MDTDTNQGAPQKSYRTIGVVALICVVALMGWLAYYNLNNPSSADQTLREQFVWKFTDAEPLPEMARRTTVTLEIAGATLPVGTYPGTCQLIDGQELKLIGEEVSGIVCRGGEGGSEIGVFRENDGLVLKRSPVMGAEGRGTNFVPITKEQI